MRHPVQVKQGFWLQPLPGSPRRGRAAGLVRARPGDSLAAALYAEVLGRQHCQRYGRVSGGGGGWLGGELGLSGINGGMGREKRP